MEQDPLASAAPVLQSGPGALDIGYKRMGIEADAAKLAASKEAALNKLKEAQKKRAATAFKIDAEVPFFTHKAAFAQDWKAEEDWLAQKMMDYDQGKGDDPMDPTSKAGIERQFRAQQLKMKTGYSKQMGDMYVKATDYIDKNYNNLKPGTKEKLDAWISDIDNLTKGETYDPIIGNIDLNKVVQGQLKELATSTTGAAWVDPITGESHSFQTDQIIAPQVLAGIQGVLSDHYNREQAEFDAAEIAIADPVRYKRIVELAAKNNIPVADALIFDYAAPVYTMKQHTETVGQVNEAGAGRADKSASAKELLETGFGIASGLAKGRKVRDVIVATPGEVTNFLQKHPKVLDKTRFDLETHEIITNYNNLYYDTQVLEDGKKIPSKIRGIVRDKNTGNVRVMYSTDDQGADVTVTEEIPEKEFYSKVIRRIALNTPEYDINTLDRVAQEEYKLIDGSGGQILMPKRGTKGSLTVGNKNVGKADNL
jgi:hypothetical protein